MQLLQGGRRGSTATRSCASSSSIQYTRNDTDLGARDVPGARRDPRGVPGLRGDRLPRDAVRRRGRAASSTSTRSPARSRRRARARRDLARDALRAAEDTIERALRRDRARAERALRPARGGGQAARVAPAAPAHAVRHGDAARDGLLQRGSRTTRASSTAARPARGRTACSTTSRTTSSCFIDESHQTVPQIGGMYEGDRSRKQTLVDYGFRLPSALDNRPLTFDEFLEHAADGVRVRDARASTSARTRADRRADRPPDRDRRSGGRGARDQATRSTTS